MKDKNFNSSLLMKLAKKKLNLSDEEIQNDISSNNIDGLLKNVNDENKDKIKNILGDPEKIKKIVSSPEFVKLAESFKKK